MTKKMIIRYV